MWYTAFEGSLGTNWVSLATCLDIYVNQTFQFFSLTIHGEGEGVYEQLDLKVMAILSAVANRLRRRTSDQTVLGSNPAVAAALSPWTRLFTPIVPRRSLHISFYQLSGHPCKIYTGKKKKNRPHKKKHNGKFKNVNLKNYHSCSTEANKWEGSTLLLLLCEGTIFCESLRFGKKSQN